MVTINMTLPDLTYPTWLSPNPCGGTYYLTPEGLPAAGCQDGLKVDIVIFLLFGRRHFGRRHFGSRHFGCQRIKEI
jgi:hypothetical protein